MGLRRGVRKLSLNAPLCGWLGPGLGGREKGQERDVGRDVGKDDARNYTRHKVRMPDTAFEFEQRSPRKHYTVVLACAHCFSL